MKYTIITFTPKNKFAILTTTEKRWWKIMDKSGIKPHKELPDWKTYIVAKERILIK